MNHKIVYKKLVEVLKDEFFLCKRFKACCECERLRNEGMKELLEWIFRDALPELEGKKCKRVFFNETEFSDWKKEIQK